MNPATPTGRNTLAKRIAPGIWMDGDGNPHFSIPELLELFELEDTPANRDSIAEIVRNAVHARNPNAFVLRRETPHEAGEPIRAPRKKITPASEEAGGKSVSDQSANANP